MRQRYAGAVLVLGLLGMLVSGVAAAPPAVQSAEQVVRAALQETYQRSPALESNQRTLLQQAHDMSSLEVRLEVDRTLENLAAEYEQAREAGIELHRTDVEINIRSLQVLGSKARAEVEVLASILWSYRDKPLETPWKIYNIHELELTKQSGQWQITRNRNLASAEKPQLTRPPAIEGVGTHSGGGGGGGGGGPTDGSDWYPRRCSGSTCTYDRTNAQQYAYQFWRSGNSDYINYGNTDSGDCTNFTSQVIYEGGGYPFRGTVGDKRVPGWWYNFRNNDHSSSWGVSHDNAFFMRQNYGVYIGGNNPVNLVNEPQRASELEMGDFIYYDWADRRRWNWRCFCWVYYGDGIFDHTAVVTSFDNNGAPRVTYRNSRGNSPNIDRPWQLSSRKETVRGLRMHGSITP